MDIESPGRAGTRIGELAASTGLTVRTLHYYEEIGLLRAASRTDSGHRVYSSSDVDRLYRICLLRRLGLTLDDISRALDEPDWDLPSALRTHQQTIARRIEAETKIQHRLTRLVASIDLPADADGSDNQPNELLNLMEEMIMLDSTVNRRISILVYSDIEAAHEFLVNVFGLGPGELTRDGDGNVVHGELQAGDGVIWLHPESPEFGLQSPATLGASTSTTAIMVDDVDAHFEHVKAHGATIKYEPVDQPYGYREFSALDLEGALWSFMKPLD